MGDAMSPTLVETLEFVKAAHGGQLDLAGAPYWEHLVAVAGRLDGNTAKTVALLHDVIEDTFVTLEVLRELGYSEQIVAAVGLLSRPKGRDYLDWITELGASGNTLAIKVKLADIADHFARPASLPGSLRCRYVAAWEILTKDKWNA